MTSTPPPPAPTYGTPPPQPPRRRRRRPSCLVIVLVLAVVGCLGVIVIGVGGYLLVQSGTISLNQREIRNALGVGTGEIGLVNIADENLSADLMRLDTESGQPERADSATVVPLEIAGFGGIEPGRYELTLSTEGGAPAGGTCRLVITSGDSYQFVAVPEGIAVTREGADAQSAEDMRLDTSPLCNQ